MLLLLMDLLVLRPNIEDSKKYGNKWLLIDYNAKMSLRNFKKFKILFFFISFHSSTLLDFLFYSILDLDDKRLDFGQPMHLKS